MTDYEIMKELVYELLCDNEKLRKRVEELEERASECEGYYDDEEDEQDTIDRLRDELGIKHGI